jgi:hypothetical protein
LKKFINKVKTLVEDYAKTLEQVVYKVKQTIVFFAIEMPKMLPEEAKPIYTLCKKSHYLNLERAKVSVEDLKKEIESLHGKTVYNCNSMRPRNYEP